MELAQDYTITFQKGAFRSYITTSVLKKMVSTIYYPFWNN